MAPPAVTEAQLRAAIQLPLRPYSDVYIYDGSPYYDLSRREIASVLFVSGMASGSGFFFRPGIDYVLNNGCIDWTIASGSSKLPDFGTAMTIDYTYSRLGSASAANALQYAAMIVTMDLGVSFPYGASTSNGVAYSGLALMGQVFCAAREACVSMISSEIDLAEKYRRGTVQVDDTKKTADWIAASEAWDARYKRYLTTIRPGGAPTAFSRITANSNTLVFSQLSDTNLAAANALYASGDWDASYGEGF